MVLSGGTCWAAAREGAKHTNIDASSPTDANHGNRRLDFVATFIGVSPSGIFGHGKFLKNFYKSGLLSDPTFDGYCSIPGWEGLEGREESRDSVCHGAAQVASDHLTGACACVQALAGADPVERVLRLLPSQPVVLAFLPSL